MLEFPVIHKLLGKFMELPRDHVNAYIVELENSVVVIDTTLALSSAQELRKKANSFGKPVEAVLLTHGHPDHYTGLVAFEDLPRFASQGCLEFAKREDETKSSTAINYLGEDYPRKRLFPNEIVRDGDSLTFGGVKFTFTGVGPGESDDDSIWTFRKNGITHAFIGDLATLNCHCFFRDGHVFEWQDILKRLKQDFDERSTRFYTGHGPSPVGMECVDWQTGYNNAFINAVAALEDRSVPVSRESRDKIAADMQRYLPSETTLFLLTYELDISIQQLIEKRMFTPGRGKDFYNEQLMLMSSGKIDELVEKHYHSDAVMVTFDGMRRGHEELKKYYVDTLKIMRNITFMATEYFAEIEDVIIFRATITSEGRGTVQALNGLYMKDGKIYRHIALTLLPDVDYDRLGTKWTD
ncbi:MAG: MBL fold metallo-hydrolase [bacterium]